MCVQSNHLSDRIIFTDKKYQLLKKEKRGKITASLYVQSLSNEQSTLHQKQYTHRQISSILIQLLSLIDALFLRTNTHYIAIGECLCC